MMGQRVASCVLCLAVLALSAQDLPPPLSRGHYKRAEIVPDSFLPDHQFSDRNTRQSKFWSGSRYGRAGHEIPQPRLEVEPRGDRFFMGSRYGKRSRAWPGKFQVRSEMAGNRPSNPYFRLGLQQRQSLLESLFKLKKLL